MIPEENIFIESRESQYASPAALLNRIGSKAANLITLAQQGCLVPAWFVLPSDLLFDLIPAEVIAQGDAKKQQAFIENYNFSLPFIKKLKNTLSRYGWADKPLAVRSSSIAEDLPGMSYAGVYTSVLNVNADNLISAIKTVWKSSFSEELKNYQRLQKAGESYQGIAVIIQELIVADSSGVAFGMNPLNGNRKEKLINAVFGLGEGLVSGTLDADQFSYSNGNLKTKIASKRTAVRLGHDAQHPLIAVDLPSTMQQTASLNIRQVAAISKVLDQLYLQTGRYQDIEFAVKGDTIYYLQARPISLSQLGPAHEDDLAIWQNANIQESYPGQVQPLTFSFVRRTYEYGNLQLAETLVKAQGKSLKHVEKIRPYFTRMVGLINGQLYYNTITYYQLLSILPGFKYTARWFEQAIGAKPQLGFNTKQAKQAWWKELWYLNCFCWSMLFMLLTLPRKSKKFFKWLDTTITSFNQLDLVEQSASELKGIFDFYTHKILKGWKVPVLNGIYTMAFFGLLKSLSRKWAVSERTTIYNDLLSGEGNIISVEIVKGVFEICTLVKANPAALKLFEDQPLQFVYDELQKAPFAMINQAIQAYIQDYGLRCAGGELKMEAHTYQDYPLEFLAEIKTCLSIDYAPKPAGSEQALRKAAVQEVKKNLRNPFKRAIYFLVLRITRFLVSNRENTRYSRTRVFHLVRQIFVHLGLRFSAEGILQEKEDIFFLSLEEAFDYVQGTSINTDLQQLVNQRRKDYTVFASRTPRGRIQTQGIVYAYHDFFSPEAPSENLAGEGDLQGIGCCPGKVRGRIRIVSSADELQDLEGDILVAQNVDPGWVKLFPTASAILLERGSPLSHVSIVTRELGIPCIISINGLMARATEGMEVAIDGSTGAVKILESKKVQTAK